MTETSDKPTGTCRVCGGGFTLTKNGRVRSHGPRGDACGGGSDLPKEAEDASGDGPSQLNADAPAQPSWAGVNPFHGDPYCEQCDTDTHRCPGCGEPVPHGTVACAKCEAETAAVPPRPVPSTDPFGVVDTDDVLLRASRMSPTVAALQQKYRPDLGGPVSGTDRTFRNNLDRSGPAPARPAQADEDADARALLGVAAPRSQADEDADAAALLSGTGPQDEGGPGPYFLSSYDGTCGPCGSWFPEGSRIRATGDGEYQGEECCGRDEDMGAEDAEEAARAKAPKPVRPRRVADAAPMNGNNQYKLPHPATGKLMAFSRATTYVKLASDHRALFDWELRCALVGVVNDERIVQQVASLMEQARAAGDHPATVVKTERQALNTLAVRAKDAAKTKEQGKSAIGTQVHKFTENVDAGMITVDQVPQEHRAAVRRYRDLVESSGFEVLPDLIEFTTALPGLKVAGRGDQIWRRTEDGVYMIVDKKSGELTWGRHEIAAQLAVYAHGFNENGVCVWNGEGDKTDPENWHWVRPLDPQGNRITVSETEAVVVHMPQDGRGDTLQSVPIDKGWEVVDACRHTREVHRMKVDFTLIAVPDAVDGPAGEASVPVPEPGKVFTAGRPGISAVDPRDTGHAPRTDGGDPRDTVPAAAPAPAPAVRIPSWEVSFSLVRTKADANNLWREAKQDPEMTPERLAALVACAGKALADWEKWSEWEQEFRAVQDRDQANAAYRAAKADPWMTPERLADLLRIGRETLARN